jgi:hypothetical protein
LFEESCAAVLIKAKAKNSGFFGWKYKRKSAVCKFFDIEFSFRPMADLQFFYARHCGGIIVR